MILKVDRSVTSGFGTTRIVLRHILPNILGCTIAVAAAIDATHVMLKVVTTFLCVSNYPPTPLWSKAMKDIVPDFRSLDLMTVLFILILVLLLTLLRNGSTDAWNLKTNHA